MGGMKLEASTLLLLLVLFFFSVPMAMGYEGKGGGERGEMFLLQRSKMVVKTEAGMINVVKGYKTKGVETPMHIGFITMEPKSLLIPQYIDSSLIIFIRRGEAKIGWIYKDDLVERQLKMGDVYRIPAGSAFYMVNTNEGQRLQIICSIDTSESLGMGVFQSFFIGGGTNPTSVLAGFDHRTLTTAFNVTPSELDEIMSRRQGGPIVYVTGADQPSRWASFMQLKQQERLKHLQDQEEEEVDEEQQSKLTWRKLLNSVLGKENKRGKGSVRAPDSYNLYDRKPDFKNSYGWSLALDEHDYAPLSRSGVGVYLVNLTAGSMMAPHVNPTATEYGIVLRGSGSIQVVFPNGSSAMNAKVEEGDAFFVPRYFPFCQIASRGGPMEFFGFTTSARKNRPQFLVGASSILQTLSGPELATAFDVSEKRFNNLINSQHESIILPSAPAAQLQQQLLEENMEGVEVEPLIRSFGTGYDRGF